MINTNMWPQEGAKHANSGFDPVLGGPVCEQSLWLHRDLVTETRLKFSMLIVSTSSSRFSNGEIHHTFHQEVETGSVA